jgi:phospholipid-binding lipoprotein MlaA
MRRPTTVATRRAPRLAASMAALLLAGCATTTPRVTEADRLDPWENWNRKVFSFNEQLDEAIIKPVATAWRRTVPPFVRQSFGNFIGNIQDGWSAINHFLQGKGESGTLMVMRVATNTVLGFAGIADVATEAGLEKRPEDFGQTLGVWGMGAGAYIVWPIFGPSSVRDSIGLPLDLSASPGTVLDVRPAAGFFAVQLINTRANYLDATRLLDDIALDKYSFVRDAYLTRRRSLVFDGDLPEDKEPPPSPAAASAPAR